MFQAAALCSALSMEILDQNKQAWHRGCGLVGQGCGQVDQGLRGCPQTDGAVVRWIGCGQKGERVIKWRKGMVR